MFIFVVFLGVAIAQCNVAWKLLMETLCEQIISEMLPFDIEFVYTYPKMPFVNLNVNKRSFVNYEIFSFEVCYHK